MSQKSNRKSIFEIMRLSRQSNCCNDLFNSFSQIDFINNLKIKYKNYISKKVIDTIKIPESRDYENIDKDFLIFLKKKESEEDNSLIVKTNSISSLLYSTGRPGLPVLVGITRLPSFISDLDMKIDKLPLFLSDLLYSDQFLIFLLPILVILVLLFL